MVVGQDGNQLVNLLVILSMSYILLKFVLVIYWITDLTELDFRVNILNHLILYPNLQITLKQPWTILTYMFIHDDVMRALGNILWLWAFGFIMQDLMGNRKIIPLFIYGGLTGAILFLVTYNLFFKGQLQVDTLLGAAPGVMAIAIASTLQAPRYRLFPMLNGGIPLWVLTVVFILVDFASVDLENTPAQVAHAGGALVGWVFVLLLKRNFDITSGMNYVFDKVANLFNPAHKSVATQKQKHFYKVGTTHPFRKVPNITQQRIDTLLDKIHQNGYGSLTEEEKEILKRASEGGNNL
jgi:membrane associated rhomboid family serine protease